MTIHLQYKLWFYTPKQLGTQSTLSQTKPHCGLRKYGESSFTNTTMIKSLCLFVLQQCFIIRPQNNPESFQGIKREKTIQSTTRIFSLGLKYILYPKGQNKFFLVQISLSRFWIVANSLWYLMFPEPKLGKFILVVKHKPNPSAHDLTCTVYLTKGLILGISVYYCSLN